MFQVGRYDPAAEKRKKEADAAKKEKKNKKRRRPVEEEPAIRVIAPEAEAVGVSSTEAKVSGEGFDDLEIVEDDIIEDKQQQLPDEIEAAKRIAELPLLQVAKAWNLPQFLIDNLQRDGFEHFFPIQALAIPDVMASERHSHLRCRDVCIAAPTGSGKTLAYVLPVVHSLARRQIRRLRALVVLPSRDLAIQVHRVFERYVEGSDLRVGLAIGQTDFRKEQLALLEGQPKEQLKLDPGNVALALRIAREGDRRTTIHASPFDILVCTPGRLIDHMDNTPGFHLHDLRLLVVDEADRLMTQSYQNWIKRVMEDANAASIARHKELVEKGSITSELPRPISWRRGGVEGDTGDTFNTNDSYNNVVSSVVHPVQLRKFLVSATLTKDPQKLASFRLVNPKHFDVHQMLHADNKKYGMPPSLAEWTVECTAEQKPLVLLALLLERLPEGMIIVFTSNLDSTHRLARLLQLVWAATSDKSVVELSSALNQRERSALLQQCTPTTILICSDGLSRGMDLEGVATVVNYDVPQLAKTYVHRCGRTARAGRSGTAINVLKGGQIPQFERLRQLVQEPQRVRPHTIQKSLVRDFLPRYRTCLTKLKEVLAAEEQGDLSPTQPIPESFW